MLDEECFQGVVVVCGFSVSVFVVIGDVVVVAAAVVVAVIVCCCHRVVQLVVAGL